MSELNNAVLKASTSMLQKFNNRFNKSQRESEQVLSDWAEYLTIEKGFTVSQIGFALGLLMQKGARFMPSAYEIEAELLPSVENKEDMAPLIANEIISAIRLFGPHKELELLESVSENAKLTVMAFGGTTSIRNAPEESLGMTRAQIERVAKGVLASKTNDTKNEKLERLGISTGKVLNFKTMDFSNYLPEVN